MYVATPHSRHAADAILYLEAGKHVLCEKPFTLNAAQARHVFEVADRHDRFVMEALWSRFLPPYEVLGRLLDDGAIGRPLLVEADFGFRSEIDPGHRHFDLAQGGGALLDLGIYPVQLSTLVFGAPDRITADGNIGSTGVDEDVAVILHHAGGGLSVLKASIRTPHACAARIAGTGGVIEIPAFMHCPDRIVLVTPAGRDVIDGAWEGEGLRFEIDEVNRCIAGRSEGEPSDAGLRDTPAPGDPRRGPTSAGRRLSRRGPLDLTVPTTPVADATVDQDAPDPGRDQKRAFLRAVSTILRHPLVRVRPWLDRGSVKRIAWPPPSGCRRRSTPNCGAWPGPGTSRSTT